MDRLLTFGLLVLALASPARAERVTLVVTRLPAETPAGARLTLGANLNGWNPAAPGFAFEGRSDGTHRLTIDVPAGTLLEYKLTRGSWETVETAADGQPRGDRTLDVECEAMVEIVVAGWADGGAR